MLLLPPKTPWHGAHCLLSTEKLRRSKRILIGLAVVYAVLSAATWASASHHPGTPGNADNYSYRTQLKHDLDGDHIPDSATIRQHGALYQVNIHFSTGRPKLRLTTYLTAGTAGLSLQTIDDDNDSQGEFLVIISATSVRPVAVWANQGKGFKRISSWIYGGVGRYRGPTIHHQRQDEPVPVGASPNPPLQAAAADQLFGATADAAGSIHCQPEQVPFDSILWRDPSRGPPSTSRV
jgi:hypothetical protein